MQKVEKNQIGKILIIAAILIITIVCTYWSVNKNGMFLDEIFSYGLSNSEYAPFLTRISEDGITDKVLSHDDILNYVSVDKSDRFDFGSVYYNQTQDVHPPLFYFLLHTLSSFVPGVFSKWFGLVLNFVLFIISIAILYKILMELGITQNSAVLCSFLYALSRAGLSTFLMIRMYMLLTVLTLLLVLLCIRFMDNYSFKFCIAIGIIIFAGMLTQYFFVIYALFICAMVDIRLLMKKNWKGIWQFSVCSIAGVALMLEVFPYWNTQLHSQTTTSLDTVVVNITGGGYADRIVSLSKQTAVSMPLIGLFIIVIIFMFVSFQTFRKYLKTSVSFECMLICIPAIISFLIIGIIAPYTAIRYVYNILPFVVLPVGYGFDFIFKKIGWNRYKVVIAISSLFAILFAFVLTPSYVYMEYGAINKLIDSYGNSPCVYIIDNKDNINASITSDVVQLLYFDNVCVIESTMSGTLAEYMKSYEFKDNLILYIDEYPEERDDSELVESLMEEYRYSVNELIYERTDKHVYLLSK